MKTARNSISVVVAAVATVGVLAGCGTSATNTSSGASTASAASGTAAPENNPAGDILFIDSTHVVRFDSDVVYKVLDILPISNPVVIIHVHDIFFPNDYPELWLQQHRFF